VAPQAPAPCDTYFDLLGALQYLATYANAEWYEEFTRPLYRLREFVAANLDADLTNTPSVFNGRCTRSTSFLAARRVI